MPINVTACCLSILGAAFLLAGADAAPPDDGQTTRPVMQATVPPDQSKITVTEDGKPVLVYNFQTVPVPEGVGGKYAVARSNYIHPLFGLDGEVLTMDYSPDHPHHRGIYWAWPEVTYTGKTHDLHALQGVFARPVKIVNIADGTDAAAFTVENEWRWEDEEPIVRELATIRVGRTTEDGRMIDFDLRFEALKPGIMLARRGKSHYGGLNVRLSARQDQQIGMHNDPVDTFPRQSWAHLTGVAPGGKSPVSILILQAWTNPKYPGDWVDYPNLNWLQPTFPDAGTAFPLSPGDPLVLRYRLCVRRGMPEPDTAAALWEAYNQVDGGRLAQLGTYRFGNDRTFIAGIEKHIRASQGEERSRLQEDLLQLLETTDATVDARNWACRQLSIIGTAESIPALARLLMQPDMWRMACYALRAIPAPQAGMALRDALPALPAERMSTVLGAIGERRDADAVAAVLKLSGNANPVVRAAAVRTLGQIGTLAAATALDKLQLDAYPMPGILDARLHCADLLRQGGETDTARRVFSSIWAASASSARRSAALIGLARCGGTDLLPTVLEALEQTDVRLRGAAVTALPMLRSAESAVALTQKLPTAAPELQLMILPLLAEWDATESHAQVAKLLDSDSDAVRMSAVDTLTRLGGSKYAEQIAEIATEGGDIAKVARDGLVKLRGAEVHAELRRLATNASPAVRKVAIDAMTNRSDPGTVDTLLALAGGDVADPATNAFAGLRQIADIAHLPRLLQLYVAASATQREAAGGAVLGVILRAETPNRHAPALIEAVRDAPEDVQSHALGLLARIGGDAAFAAVRKAVASPSPAVRTAAVRALAAWPTPDAIAALLQVLDAATEARDRVLLLRGIVRLVPVSDRSEQEKADILASLSTQELSAQEQKLLIAALGGMKASAVLPVLTQYLVAQETAAEAAQAIRQAVLPAEGHPGLVGAEAKKALLQAITHLGDEDQRQEAKSYLAEIAGGDIARGKPATSNHPAENGHPPTHAVDGIVSPQSYWGCAEGPPAQLRIDLQDTLTVGAIHLYTYWDGRRYYQYTIELSEDGETWREVVDRRANTERSTAQGVRFEIEPAAARFVRVTMLKNSANPGLHIVELKVFEEVTD